MRIASWVFYESVKNSWIFQCNFKIHNFFSWFHFWKCISKIQNWKCIFISPGMTGPLHWIFNWIKKISPKLFPAHFDSSNSIFIQIEINMKCFRAYRMFWNEVKKIIPIYDNLLKCITQRIWFFIIQVNYCFQVIIQSCIFGLIIKQKCTVTYVLWYILLIYYDKSWWYFKINHHDMS